MESLISKARNGVALFLALLLSVSLVPGKVWAEPSSDSAEAASWTGSIGEMLESGTYVEGEALAVVSDGSAAFASNGPSASLLEGCEPLAQVSEEAYNQAAGVEQVQAYGLDSADGAGDSAVDIVLVKRSGMSTEEILKSLADDASVLYAEPNYTKEVAENEGEALGGADAQSGVSVPGSEKGVPPSLDAGSGEGPEAASAAAGESNEGTSSDEDASSGEGASQADSSVVPVMPADKTNSTMLPKDQMPDLTPYQWAFDSSDVSNVFTGQRLLGYDSNVPGWNDPSSENAAGVVALLDTGVDYHNPDLNGVMMDMSPYAAEIGGGRYGLNACPTDSQDETDPSDDFGHGTHVAGIMAAQWDGHGVSGAANGVKLLPVKISLAGAISTAAAVKGAQYLCDAIDAGVDIRVVNNSWGGNSSSLSFLLMVNALGQRGCVSVCASGNDAVDLDATVRTPTATSASPYSIVVNASGPDASKTVFTDWGQETTNLYAPGGGILSTYPYTRSVGGVEGNTILGSYMPSVIADADAEGNVAYDSFDGSGSIEAYVGYGSDAIKPENLISKTSDSVHFDKKGSLAISGAQLKAGDQGEQDDGQAKHSYAVMLKIPMAQNELAGAANFAFSTLSNTGNYQVVATCAELADESGGSARMVRDEWQTARACPTIGWTQESVDLSDLINNWGEGNGFAYHTDPDGSGYIVMALMYLTSSDYQPQDSEYVYLDCVGLGNCTVPYAYMSGTSMASPLVAGAAAVASTRVDSSLSPSERALEVVSLINGCTTQRSEYEGTCTSGGYLDCSSIDNASSRHPVIDSVAVEGTGESSGLVVLGTSFGDEEGALAIDGIEAPVCEWSAGKVRAARPNGITSGKHLVKLTMAAGKTCSKTCVIEFSDVPGDIPLFEKEISLEGATFATDAKNCKMEAEGNRLFVFPAHRDAEDMSLVDMPYRECWSYDIDSGSWSKLCDLPIPAGTVSVANHDGSIYALIRTGDSSLAEQHLYRLDTANGSWNEVGMEEVAIPIGAALVEVRGALLSVGGGEVVEDLSSYDVSKTSDNICKIDLDAGTAKPVGSLVVPRSLASDSEACDLKVAASGSTVYVAGGCRFAEDGSPDNNLETEAFEFDGSRAVSSALVGSSLPSEKKAFNGRFALAADDSSAYVAGYKSDDANDSFALSRDDAAGLGKRLSYNPLSWPSALVHEGVLYGMGVDELSGGKLVMRATVLPSQPAPGPDPAPSPVPGDPGSNGQTSGSDSAGTEAPKASPDTGDHPCAPFAAGCVLLLVGALSMARKAKDGLRASSRLRR